MTQGGERRKSRMLKMHQNQSVLHIVFYKQLLYKQRYTLFFPKIKQLSTRPVLKIRINKQLLEATQC